MSEMAAPEKAGKSSTQVIVPVNGFGMPQEDVAMFTCPDWMTERTYACSVMFSTLISSSDTTYTVTLKGEEHQELLTSTLQDKKTSAKFALAGKKAYLMHGSNTHSTIQSAIWPGLVQFTWVS